MARTWSALAVVMVVAAGELAAGDAGYNEPWSWHMAPATVHAPLP